MQYLIKESKMNTQKEVKPQPDRPLRTNHVVVEAHGEATPDHVAESDFDGHINGEFPHQGENDQRTTKASKATAGRHITSKDGLVVAKERSKSIEANRKASAACFNSAK